MTDPESHNYPVVEPILPFPRQTSINIGRGHTTLHGRKKGREEGGRKGRQGRWESPMAFTFKRRTIFLWVWWATPTQHSCLKKLGLSKMIRTGLGTKIGSLSALLSPFGHTGSAPGLCPAVLLLVQWLFVYTGYLWAIHCSGLLVHLDATVLLSVFPGGRNLWWGWIQPP